MADEGRIAELIIRRLRQELTRPDQEALSAWLDVSSDNRDFVDILTGEAEIVAGLRILKGMDKAAIRRKVQYLMSMEEGSATLRPVRTIARYWFAAAVFAGMLVGWGIYQAAKNEKSSLERNAAPPVLQTAVKGVNRASLLLTDGTTILLDTTRIGTIHGNALLSKVDSDRLVFRSDQREVAGMYMLSVPAGARYQAQLPDGSRIFLNAGSSLRFPTGFNKKERRVELHGEGWFDVARDADRPFVVVSDRQRVEVLGTAFDVCDYPDEPFRRTTVEKGRVHVRSLIGVTDSVSLAAGQEAQVNGDSAHMKILSGIHAAHASAWRRGYFNFDNLDIQAAVNKMARWYDKKVSLQHVTIGTLGSGDIQQDLTLPVLLKDLELPDLHFEIRSDTIVVKR